MLLSRNFVKRAPTLFYDAAAVLARARVSSTYEAHQNSKFMQKLINKKGAKTNKQWYKPHLGEPLEVESKKTKKGISHSHSVRLRQHSHVLYDKITEMINTGELSQEILDKQVSIVLIKMHKDMNNLSIYWDADRKDSESVEQLLQAHCGKLRSLLISYHILGRIPHIVFVQDKTSVNLNQLAQLFAVADYGPDYVSGTSMDDNLKKRTHEDHTLDRPNVPDSDYLNEKVDSNEYLQSSVENKLDSTSEQSHVLQEQPDLLDGGDKNLDLEMPATAKELDFRSDVYGLSRDEMMKKVLAKKKRPYVSECEKVSSSLDFDSSSDIVTGLHFPVLPKTELKQKLMREERRWREKMLERDDFDL